MDKKQSRLRRSLQTRHKIAELRVDRLTVFRSNLHIYANIVAATGDKVLVSASTLETEVRAQLAGQTGRGGNAAAAAL
ncbi:MAG: 50S ribosomal protein L18, partial [Burkholderiales bacterium]